MANNEELGKLSPEQIQKLANAIAEAKNLPGQQEEIIQKVMAGEVAIGNARLAALEKYFDIYSKNLDQIARKYSTMDDSFLVLGKKISGEYKKLSSDLDKVSKQIAKASTATSNKKTKQSGSDESGKDLKKKEAEKLKTIEDVHKQHLAALKARRVQYEQDTLKLEYARSEENKHILLRSKEFRLAELSAIAQAEQKAQDTSNRLDYEIDSAKTTTGAKNRGDRRVQLLEAEEKEKSLQKLKEQMDAKRLQLEFEARAENNGRLLKKDAAAIAKQISEEYAEKEKRLKELTEERFAQERLLADPKLRDAFEKERLKRKQELELEAMRRNNSIITKEELIAINAQLDEEFQLRAGNEDRLKDLAQKRLADAKIENVDTRLNELKQEDPSLAIAREAKIKKEIADLEYQYRLAHDNELNEQARKEIEYQAKLKYLEDSEAIGELSKKYAEQVKLDYFKENDPRLAQTREEEMSKDKFRLELEARRRNNGILTKEDNKRIKDQLAEKYKLEGDAVKELSKKQIKEDQKRLEEEEKAKKKKAQAEAEEQMSTLFGKGQSIKERVKAFNKLTQDEDTGKRDAGAVLLVAVNALSDFAKKLNNTVDEIAAHKGVIDTRLQGSSNKTFAGSYWDQLVKDMASVGAVTPYFKQEDFAKNIETLVNRGIAFDLKQRAFLMTIQEKIANTFNVADGTLLRLIRIQQEDSTAGRLGMESALNSFLNEMYETSEYLSDVAVSVRGSLAEMEALMTGAEATEVEYQVQKWMGSLYSVGMSQEAVQGIASALGQIAAGQVDALISGTGASNLLIMAANQAGKSISEILTEGLNAQETNDLMQAMVNYLADLAEASKDSRVVQQQLANVYGVKASDLKAATNLATTETTDDIYKKSLTYDNMLNQLFRMAGSMGSRTSIGEMMSNVWANGQYTLAGSMASSPISYLTYKLASLLDSTVGGIGIPSLTVMMNGVDLETTVADLMRVASIGTGILGSLGPIISGLSSSFSGQAMLQKMGIEQGSGLAITPRGDGGLGALDSAGGGQSTSGSGYVGNASGSDVKNATLQEADDTKKKEMIKAKEEEPANQIDMINTSVLKIYELLDNVANGKQSLSVKVSSYGLTGIGSSTSALGGVSGLLSNNTSGTSGSNTPSGGSANLSGGSSSGSGSSGGGNDLAGFGSGGIDLGGWTIM